MLLILTLAALTFYSGNLSFVNGQSTPAARTPIKHIVFIIQENHSFDNLFGTFPNLPKGAGLNLATCMPENPPSTKPCEKPFNADSQPTVQQTDQCHTAVCANAAYNKGLMNGFYKVDKTNTMAYYDGSGIPYYWDYAQYYTLNYNFFASAMSYSEPNHLYAVAANSPKLEVDQQKIIPYNLTFPQIAEVMTPAGVSWGYYQYNWNDKLDCTGTYTGSRVMQNIHGGFDTFWAGLAQFKQVQITQKECSSLQNLTDLKNEVNNNTLPAVSWVIPEPQVSDHPAQSALNAGELYVSSVINAIEKSPEWTSTVIYLTWDDYGGYYDGVVPAQLDAFGNGFRVPLIAISPFSIPGGIVSGPSYTYFNNATKTHGTTMQDDFSAFLSTIEYNWNLHNVTIRDGEEPNLFYMLNFKETPLKPLFLGTSGVVYPYTSCISSGGCSMNAPLAQLQGQGIYNTSSPSWAESNQQALQNAGNGDPTD